MEDSTSARPEDYHDLSVVHSGPTDHDVVQAFDVMADIRWLLARLCGHMMAEAGEILYHGAYPELVRASVEEMLLWTVLRTQRFRQSRLQQRSDNSPGLTHLIEFWAGVGNLTKEHVRLGFRVPSIRHGVQQFARLHHWARLEVVD
jgi:hypothetical protein